MGATKGGEASTPAAAQIRYDFSVHGYRVSFPNEPYGVQRSFMSQLLRTLKEKVRRKRRSLRLAWRLGWQARG